MGLLKELLKRNKKADVPEACGTKDEAVIKTTRSEPTQEKRLVYVLGEELLGQLKTVTESIHSIMPAKNPFGFDEYDIYDGSKTLRFGLPICHITVEVTVVGITTSYPSSWRSIDYRRDFEYRVIKTTDFTDDDYVRLAQDTGHTLIETIEDYRLCAKFANYREFEASLYKNSLVNTGLCSEALADLLIEIYPEDKRAGIVKLANVLAGDNISEETWLRAMKVYNEGF